MRTEGSVSPTRNNRFRTPCAACPLLSRATFRDFEPSELEFVEWFKRGELSVEAGAPIVQEATSSAHLFTILEGWAFRYKTLPDGRRQILNFAMPGDLIGLQTSVFETMDHGVEALSQMTLCVFPVQGTLHTPAVAGLRRHLAFGQPGASSRRPVADRRPAQCA